MEQLLRYSAECLTLALPFRFPCPCLPGPHTEPVMPGCAQCHESAPQPVLSLALPFVFIHESAQHPALGFQAENNAADLVFQGDTLLHLSSTLHS